MMIHLRKIKRICEEALFKINILSIFIFELYVLLHDNIFQNCKAVQGFRESRIPSCKTKPLVHSIWYLYGIHGRYHDFEEHRADMNKKS